MDDLFDGFGRGWLTRISPECRAFLDQIVERILETGTEPIFERVHARIRERFPADAPKAVDTVTSAIRRLARERADA
ncbi:MAG TPA: hypothetical protein VF377_10430 [Acidimicrobiia bacterium]